MEANLAVASFQYVCQLEGEGRPSEADVLAEMQGWG
jgi:hypothetical protein